MPISPATSREALNTPDATPASADGMASRTDAVNGTVNPPLSPISRNAGISEMNDASAPSRLTDAMPSPMTTNAIDTTRCAPSRCDTRSDTIAPTAISSAIGTNAAPALVAEKPSTPCR